MTRLLPLGAFAAAIFSLAAGAIVWLATHGFTGAEALALRGEAIAARDGALGMREIVLAFPPVPHLAVMALGFLPEIPAMSTPALLCALVVAVTGAAWFDSLVVSGFSVRAAAGLTALLLLNPLYLRLALTSPADALLVLAASVLASAAFRLRAQSRVADLISLSFCLAFVALCHPLGVALACALAPWLVFVVQPAFARESLAGACLTILFPFLLAMAGAGALALIFGGDARGFATFATSPELTGEFGLAAAWRARNTPAIIAASLGMLAAAPVLFAVLLSTRRRLPRHLPTLALIASAPLAASLAGFFGVVREPLTIAAPLLGFAAATLTIWPPEPARAARIAALLMVGAGAGAAMIALAPSRESGQFLQALHGGVVESTVAADIAVGEYLRDHEGVLIDAVSAPGVLAGRGSAAGLYLPTQAQFEAARLSKRAAARYLAVRRATGELAAGDAVHAIFPDLHGKGMADYSRVYDNGVWRVYKRAPRAARM